VDGKNLLATLNIVETNYMSFTYPGGMGPLGSNQWGSQRHETVELLSLSDMLSLGHKMLRICSQGFSTQLGSSN
jgi:hypothetical protein